MMEYAEKATANANMLMHVVSYMAHHTTELSESMSASRTFGIPLASLSAGDKVTFSVVDGVLILSAPLPAPLPAPIVQEPVAETLTAVPGPPGTLDGGTPQPVTDIDAALAAAV